MDTSVKNTGRGFRTDFESHKGLLHKFARMVFARREGAGLAADYDDIFGDMCEAYARAVQSYDPSRGITFSAYLGRAAWNGANKVSDKVIRERTVTGICSLSEFGVEGDDEGDESIMGRISISDDMDDSPEDIALRNETMRERMTRLPLLSQAVVRELIAPSEGVRRTFQAIKAHREQAKLQNKRARKVPEDITLPVIFQHFGLSKEQIGTVKRQCLEHLGVDISGC